MNPDDKAPARPAATEASAVDEIPPLPPIETACERRACRKQGVSHWNPSTRAWYCRSCAMKINRANPGLCVDPWTTRRPIVIEVCQRWPGYGHNGETMFHAQIEGLPGFWGAGRTVMEAIGSVVRSHSESLGIRVEYLPEARR